MHYIEKHTSLTRANERIAELEAQLKELGLIP